LRKERHAALATPRQVTRFLCGITSPAAQRARLNKDKRFGLLEGAPFGEVLALAERVWREK
jgi:ATP-dependent DNA helicase RecQ